MTGYTVHTGTTIKFSEGWDRIFLEDPKSTRPAKKKSIGGAAKAKARAKRAAKRKP